MPLRPHRGGGGTTTAGRYLRWADTVHGVRGMGRRPEAKNCPKKISWHRENAGKDAKEGIDTAKKRSE